MDALITGRAALVASETDLVRAAEPAFAADGLVELTATGGARASVAPGETAINLYTPRPSESFERVAIGESLLLFDGNWGRAFLRYALSLVRPGGRLLVSRTGASAQGSYGFLSLDRIVEELAGASRVVARRERAQGSPFVLVERTGAVRQDVPSILAAYLEDFGALTGDRARFLQTREPPPWGRDDLRQALSDPAHPIAYDPAAFDPSRPAESTIDQYRNETGSIEAAYRRYVADVDSYLVDGVRYKAAILLHIIRAHFGADPGALALCDVGSASGLLPMELCLEVGSPIGHALAVDVSFSYSIATRALFERYERLLSGRYRLGLSAAEAFRFDRAYDVVSYIGSLLYVDKAKLEATVRRAFDALRPGGILVIHENVRSATSASNYAFMFTAEDIDAVLRPYGAIRYFMSTGARELKPEEIGDKTVFRVVRKPA